MRLLLSSLALSLLMSFSLGAEPTAKIIAMGDSLMAWNRAGGQSIADVLSSDLKEPVTNRSMTGARILYGLPVSGAMGMKIGKQFKRKDRADWVVVTGGGNDLMFGCGCHQCDRKLQQLVTPDGGAGAIVDLVLRIRQSGAKVVLLGYLRSPGLGSPIESCKDEGDIFDARLSRMASRIKGVHFVANADIVPHGDRSFHAFDMVHPSAKGSWVIGKRVAAVIKAHDPTR